ncbi:glycerate kinase [Nitrospirota bacterium]
MKSSPKEAILHIYDSAIDASNASRNVYLHEEKIKKISNSSSISSIYLLAFGKAAPQMASAAEEILQGKITEGLVVTKKYHAINYIPRAEHNIHLMEAGHPLPDSNSVKASEKALALLDKANKNTMVLCLISGGGSALLASPDGGIKLSEKKSITKSLLRAGADINDINTVRKHLSSVKGGKLAEAAYPARILSLLISDVADNRLDVIASGPTAPDPATFKDALDILEKFHIKASPSIRKHIENGIKGDVPETLKPGDPVFRKVKHHIIASNRDAIEAARGMAELFGFRTHVLSHSLTGDVVDAAKWLSTEIRKHEAPCCCIAGGETTVKVMGKGKGGRNTELALRLALATQDIKGLAALCVGTDGTDGPTDAAGAMVSGATIPEARKMGLSPEDTLRENDTYHFFKKNGGLLITGPTGTNVMDLTIILLT